MKFVRNLGILVLAVTTLLLTTAFILNNFVYIHKSLTVATESTVLVISPTKDGESHGTGVIFNTKTEDGCPKAFIWTCFHVVAGQVSVETEFDASTNKTKLGMKVKNPKILTKLFNQDPSEIGELTLTAKIVRFSEADDLAILEIEPGFFKHTVDFPRLSGYIPLIGTKIFHVGNFGGACGEKSVCEGITGIRGLDLDNNGKCYDRVGLSLEPGASGGGVFEASTGVCIGLMARRIHETNVTQGLIIPFRSMEKFSDRLNCRWALNRSVRVPENYLNELSDDKWVVPEAVVNILSDKRMSPAD